MESKKCSICRLDIDIQESGWDDGHNAQPVNDGRCCTECNGRVVLPARLGMHRDNVPEFTTNVSTDDIRNAIFQAVELTAKEVVAELTPQINEELRNILEKDVLGIDWDKGNKDDK